MLVVDQLVDSCRKRTLHSLFNNPKVLATNTSLGYCKKRPYGLWPNGNVALWPCGFTILADWLVITLPTDVIYCHIWKTIGLSLPERDWYLQIKMANVRVRNMTIYSVINAICELLLYIFTIQHSLPYNYKIDLNFKN